MSFEQQVPTMNASKPKPAPELVPVSSNALPPLQCVRSEDLFGKQREILIEHCGMHYHLRLTRANKLILTK